MKKVIWISQVILLLLISGCKKEEPTAIPLLTTSPITNVTATTATSGGNITSDGRSTITASGICWSTTANPTTSDSKTTDGSASGQFVSEITGLTAGLTFHVRAYATNSVGTAYGIDMSSSTLGQVPESLTQPATNKTATGATLNGTVNANYLSTVVTFEYGLTASYGSIATAIQSPVTGNTVTTVSADISGLTSETTYHFKVKAVNSLGTTYGSDVTFTTTSSVTVTDVDGNVYQTVTIGTQVWMVENLKTTKYRNGDLIGTTTPATLDIDAEATPKYQWAYEGNESNVNTYGRLYTWYAVTDIRNLCSTGWHVPSDVEWTTLENYLIANGYNYDGTTTENKIAKSLATATNWTSSSNSGAVGNTDYPGKRNATGFSALPGGSRYGNGTFNGFLSFYGIWWSSTESDYDQYQALLRYIHADNSYLDTGGYLKVSGASVRCIKD
jgi:uncharacterized protein (TIGR02145 family)